MADGAGGRTARSQKRPRPAVDEADGEFDSFRSELIRVRDDSRRCVPITGCTANRRRFSVSTPPFEAGGWREPPIAAKK